MGSAGAHAVVVGAGTVVLLAARSLTGPSALRCDRSMTAPGRPRWRST